MTRLRDLFHAFWHGHRRRPWAVDIEHPGHYTGCRTCVRDRIMDRIHDVRQRGF